jgi:hemerythrin-like domain-containing protein
MLRSILLLLARHRSENTLPDFSALRAMLFYVDEFPEQRHHRKESEVLFAKLRARTPLARERLDQRDHDHASGERRIRHLEHLLTAFEMMGAPRRDAFEREMRSYVDFYLGHMAEEERELLPLAERVLNDDDWRDIDEAFAGNRDPLLGHRPQEEYRELFSRIVRAVPAPLGLGPR